MKKAAVHLILLLVTIMTATSAGAEVRGKEFTISPFFGFKNYDGSQLLGPNFATGLGVGYNLNRNWGVESQFTYALAKASDKNYYSQYGFQGNMLYHLFPNGQLVPFIVLGGGWSRSENPIGSGQSATFNYGAGVKYFLDHTVALRTDVRQIVAFKPVNSSTAEYWQNLEFTIGLSYQFGWPPPAAVPVASVPIAAVQEQNIWLGELNRAPVGKNLITGMKFGENDLEIMAAEQISDYRVYTLTQPTRLVIEIANAVPGFSADRITVNRLGIDNVRFETYPDYLRIFLDVAEGRFFPYRLEETGKGLKIVVLTP